MVELLDRIYRKESCKSCLKYRSILNPLFAFKTKPGFSYSFACKHPRHVLTDDRPMLEPVSRSTTDNPNILERRVLIDQKIAI